MENIPKKIYLQIVDSDVTVDKSITDWNDLFHGAITWTDHRVNDNDIEYKLNKYDDTFVVGRSEQLACDCDRQPLRYNKFGICKYCGKQKPSEG